MKKLISYYKESGVIFQMESWELEEPPKDAEEIGYLLLDACSDTNDKFVKNGRLAAIESPRPSYWHSWNGLDWVDTRPPELVARKERDFALENFKFEDNLYQVDDKSLEIMFRHIHAMEEGDSVDWRTSTNTFVSMSKERLTTLYRLGFKELERVYREYWGKVDSLKSQQLT